MGIDAVFKAGAVASLMLVSASASYYLAIHRPALENRQEKEEAIRPYRSASAAEVFRMRSECAAMGEKILEGNVIGSALTQQASSHYNQKTNRCFVTIGVHSANLTKEQQSIGSYLYDGQTREQLAFISIGDGKKLDGICSRDRPRFTQGNLRGRRVVHI